MRLLPLVRLVHSVPHLFSVFILRVTEWTAKWTTTDPYAYTPPQWLYALKDTVSSGVIANTPISTVTNSSLNYGGQGLWIGNMHWYPLMQGQRRNLGRARI